MKTLSKNVNRVLEFALQPVGDAFTLLYARMKGEKDFKWGLYTNQTAAEMVELINDPRDLFPEGRQMPHAKARSGRGSCSKASDFTAYLNPIRSETLQDWLRRGVNYRWDEPKFHLNWADPMPEGWEPIWFCGYDHTALWADGRLMNLPKQELACASSNNMDKLKELVQSDDRFSWFSDEFEYVRHNGMSNTLLIRIPDEDYERFLTSGHLSGLYQVLPFLGIDHREYEAEETESEDDPW